jgi:putative transposase
VVTPAARRLAVVHACTAHDVSERRACLGVDRSSMRYRSRRACDAAVRLCIRELAAQRRRFGYRRLHLLLTRVGHHMNHKRFRRLGAPAWRPQAGAGCAGIVGSSERPERALVVRLRG